MDRTQNPPLTAIERRADEFAGGWHAREGQRRNFTGEPYIVHPRAVAQILRDFDRPLSVVVAGYLHDVLEDTGASPNEVESLFGYSVVTLVLAVTNPEKRHGESRADYQDRIIAQLVAAGADAQDLKCADIAHNCSGLSRLSPSFARTYLPKKQRMLEAFTCANPALQAFALAIVQAELDLLPAGRSASLPS